MLHNICVEKQLELTDKQGEAWIFSFLGLELKGYE